MLNTTTNTADSLRIVIIGGGISGLSLAWHLEKQAQQNALNLHYTLLEASGRFGGKVLTEQVGDFIIEAGPDSFLTQKPWALQLARELGLEDHLLGTNDDKRNVFVLNKGKPVVLPDGLLLIVPTKFMPFALSPLISPLGKLRMGLDLVIPAKTDDEDETLADFIRRRLGNEALDKIAEPLMSGIYNADADKQSVMATFPRFRTLEKNHGSLIRGMLASRRQRQSAAKSATKANKLSTFMSFNGGTNELIDALTRNLSGDLRTNTSVTAIQLQADNTYTVELEDGNRIEADIVILTTPAYVSVGLVEPFAPQAASELEGIRYVSTGTISLAFKASAMPKPLNGFGVVIPTSEDRPINALTLSSTKFDQRAPDDHILMRVFFGGSRSPQSMQLDDEALLAMVREQLKDILGIDATPLFHRIYRWWHANPQYDLGHMARIDRIEAALPQNVYVTGSAYRGVGMPDCVHQSQQTAQKLIQEYTQQELVES